MASKKKTKKPIKKAAKKPVKKAAKKAVKKKAAPKKAAKKPAAKKAAKKPAKKTAKKTVKKAAPKAAKKPAKKAAPQKAPQKAAAKTAPQKAAPKAKPAAPKAEKPAPAAGPHPLEGSSVPAVTLHNQRGESVDLASTVASNPTVVLYFYPKDDTPGCTKEACDFRDNMNRIQAAGVAIFGVSPDDSESHQKFIEKYSLNFDLLTDTDHALADTMNVWKEKSFMGKTFMGVERSTFLIKNGKIVKAWQPVKVEGHVDEVLQAAQA